MTDSESVIELAEAVAKEVGGQFWETHRLNTGLLKFIKRYRALSAQTPPQETTEDELKLLRFLAFPDDDGVNYVADREIEPRQVTFSNGRIVRVVGDGYLEVLLVDPLNLNAAQTPPAKEEV